jgi:hypothetical protein
MNLVPLVVTKPVGAGELEVDVEVCEVTVVLEVVDLMLVEDEVDLDDVVEVDFVVVEVFVGPTAVVEDWRHCE